MYHANRLYSILLLLISTSSFSQTLLKGTLTDADTKSTLPFVNIGIKNKNVGTSSRENGSFTILIPGINENDTLTFSMVGYHELNIPIKNMVTGKTIQLKAKLAQLNSVTITSAKLTEKGFGIKNNKSLIHFTDGSTNQNDIFEIAQLIKMDTVLSRITSLSLHVNDTRNDSGTFRINFYAFDGSRPTYKIVEKNILQTKAIKEGWLTFDLNAYKIYLKGKFVVSIEFIPAVKKNTPIYYEVKLGGSAKSFTRSSSQGEWVVPPHHYRLFVTALVPDTKQKQQTDPDEKESPADTVLFSGVVKDSFSLFISLPKNYANRKNEKFPVIYLLDANAYIDIVSDMIREKKNNSILIGIGYKDAAAMDSLRDRDYTFPEAGPQDSFRLSGGAGNFLSFIRTELLPFIEKSYRSDTTRRTLMGHSLGGYFTLFALEQQLRSQQQVFRAFVAASPSLEYGNKYLFNQFRDPLIHARQQKTDLYISTGGKEDDTGTETVDNFNAFYKLLCEDRFKKIRIVREIFPAYGHMETAVPTFTKAVELTKK
jgi:predicted alpha/beta superfamily hydrolase